MLDSVTTMRVVDCRDDRKHSHASRHQLSGVVNWHWSRTWICGKCTALGTTDDHHHHVRLLSRRSRKRERLNASELSICLSVCLSVCLSIAKMQKNAIFSKTKHFRAMASIDDLGSRRPTWAFQRTHYWTPNIQDG